MPPQFSCGWMSVAVIGDSRECSNSLRQASPSHKGCPCPSHELAVLGASSKNLSWLPCMPSVCQTACPAAIHPIASPHSWHSSWGLWCMARAGPTQSTCLAAVLLVALLLGLEPLLVCHVLLLHEQPVLDTLQLEQSQLALGIGCDVGQLGAQGLRIAALLLASNTRRGCRGLPLLLLAGILQSRAMVFSATANRQAREPGSSAVGLRLQHNLLSCM